VIVILAGDALLDDPVRTVHVNAFAIARAPVTSGEFEEFAGATSHTASTWRKGPLSHPVEGLSWADAVAYFRWLSVSSREDLPPAG
jgi:formylglycine-generating enzyme required for sulfatase activity